MVGHDHLQRPALARDLPGAGPAGRRADPDRLQHADPLRRPTPTRTAWPGSTTPGHAGRRLPERHVGGRRGQGRRRGGRRARWPRAASSPRRARSWPRPSTTGDEVDRGRRATSTGAGATRARCSTSTATGGPRSTAASPAQRGVVDLPDAAEGCGHDRHRPDRHHLLVNGAAGRGARRPPPPAGRAARGARRHLAQGRLLAVGPVRLLHGAGRRQGRGGLPGARWTRSRAGRSSPSRASTTTSATRYADAFAAVRRPAVRLLHARASSCGPRR